MPCVKSTYWINSFWSICPWLPQCSWSNMKIHSTSPEYGTIWPASQEPAPHPNWIFPHMCITPSGFWHLMTWVPVNPVHHPDSTEPTLHVSNPSKKVECFKIFLIFFMAQSLIMILTEPDMNPSDVEVFGTSPDSMTITWRVKLFWFDLIQYSIY